MQNFDQIFLQAVAAFLVNNVDFIAKTVNCTVINTGSGSWEIILNEPLPFGQYLAFATPTTAIAGATGVVFDGDATHKFLTTALADGTLATFNCSVVFFALPL